MTILSLCQDASTVLGLERMTQVFGSDAEEHLQLAALLNEMGERVARAADWQQMIRNRILQGDGTETRWGINSDFDRFPKDVMMRSSKWNGDALRHITSLDEWNALQLRGLVSPRPAWTIIADEYHFYPAPADGEDIKFFYISNYYARDHGGIRKPRFTADSDTFVLSERTLRLSIVAQWKYNNGLDYEMDAQIAAQALGEDVARDKGPRGITIGRPSWPRDVEPSCPDIVI